VAAGVTWVKIDDGLPESDVFERGKAGVLGGWMHIAALAYCNRTLNDGVFPRSRARRLIDIDDPDAVIDALIEHGLWRATPDGVEIVDYLKNQPSRARVEADREAWKRRQARSRQGRESRRDTSRDTKRDPTSPVPVPRTGTVRRVAGAPRLTVTRDDAGADDSTAIYYIDDMDNDTRTALSSWLVVCDEVRRVAGQDDWLQIEVAVEHADRWLARANQWLAAAA
jgi:hypothetical protein